MKQVVRDPPSGHGFTLIELLVVIAIIALLASLILPTLHRTKESAEGTVCRGNLKQMGIALRLYVDNEGVFPQSDGYGSWCAELEPYANDKWPSNNRVGEGVYGNRRGVFACPGYSRLPGFYGRRDDTWFEQLNFGPVGAYTFNSFGIVNSRELYQRPQSFTNFYKGLGTAFIGDPARRGDEVPWWGPVKENEVLSPGEMIAITDSVIVCGKNEGPEYYKYLGNGFFGHAEWYWSMNDPFPGGEIYGNNWVDTRNNGPRRHSARFNVLFCDGHTENQAPEKLFSNRDDLVRRWNRDNQPHSLIHP
ncbi:MAG: prepilin-type N-terminal cleavage/methylation domain-containing protein [Verrucomicrobia bacterium]|nr:prepilin-type N-terminal cleavage/methylation domain-containing protein [Verrucomicrobiota bacterium]